MSETFTAKIDVTKIDRSKLFDGKNGAKYLDIVLFPTPNNEFGNSHMIVQSVSKEERAAGVRGAILGNAKAMQSRAQPKPDRPESVDSSEIPF